MTEEFIKAFREYKKKLEEEVKDMFIKKYKRRIE